MLRVLSNSANSVGKGVSVFFSVILPIVLLSTSPEVAPRFVPGEILIKFVPGTEGSTTVIRASQVNPPDLGALARVIKPLEAESGIPLKASQLTGGNWVVLSIDGHRLTEQVVRQLRIRENITEVKVGHGKREAHVGVSLPKKLVIRFLPGSRESETIVKKLSDANDVGFSRLIGEFEKDLDLPLKGEVTDEAKLVVQIDLRALTLTLSERLKALSDIESAQLNYIETIR